MSLQSEFYVRFWRQLVISFRVVGRNTKSGSRRRSFRLKLKIFASALFGRLFFYLLCLRHAQLRYFLLNLPKLEHFYLWLGDDYSKSLMIELVIRKIWGGNRLPPLIDTAETASKFERAGTLLKEIEIDSISTGNARLEINCYDLTEIGYSVMVYVNPLNVVETFMLEQYRYRQGGNEIGVETGDIVIDAGGCWGDTAFYMVLKGAEKVYSFEFLSDNLAIFQKNLTANPPLGQSITVIEKAVWSQDDQLLYFQARGPGTKLTNQVGLNGVQTVTIDSFVEKEHINRVDFIKMDIEGSELDALVGTRRTIERFGPRLAITVYHKLEDLLTIPHFLNEIRPDYRFYLDHFSTTMLETVLFAVPVSGPDRESQAK